jgi:hypothetical protein
VKRVHQLVLIASTVVGSWLGMQAIHESGHVIGAWLTGGHVQRVVLHPLTISRTDLTDNPHPLLVVWAGPLIGIVAPLLTCGIAAAVRFTGTYALRFFAGFCCVANGLYIGVGSFDKIGDCGEMLRHGSDAWQLWLFGLLAMPVGFWLWNRQGPHFGFGAAMGQVDRRVAYGSLVACVALIAVGIALSA